MCVEECACFTSLYPDFTKTGKASLVQRSECGVVVVIALQDRVSE